MRIIEPKQLYLNRKKRNQARQQRITASVILGVVLFCLIYSTIALSRPLPVLTSQTAILNTTTMPVSVNWPDFGQSAVGSNGYGLLADSGATNPVPIASVAKVMTSLAVLNKVPMTTGQTGPTYTMTAQDVELYNQYLAQKGSVVAVSVGEQISQYQILQGVLLPSANNLADSLVIKVFGSMDAYLAYANNLAVSLGMTHTHIADASGFSPQTVSTADDLVKLGLAAMNQPVLKQIVAQPSANIPVEGEVQNVNFLLGQYDIIGIKTGNTDEAGGCYLFAAQHQFANGPQVTVVGAILGAADLGKAVQAAPALLDSAYTNFSNVTVVKAGQTIGTYTTAWGTRVSAVAETELSAFTWHSNKLNPKVELQTIHTPKKSLAPVGTVKLPAGDAEYVTVVQLSHNLSGPSLWWRLFDNWH